MAANRGMPAEVPEWDPLPEEVPAGEASLLLLEAPNLLAVLTALSRWTQLGLAVSFNLDCDRESRSCLLRLQTAEPYPSPYLTATERSARTARLLTSLQAHLAQWRITATPVASRQGEEALTAAVNALRGL